MTDAGPTGRGAAREDERGPGGDSGPAHDDRTRMLVRALLWLGLLLFWLVQLTLFLVADLPLIDSVLLAVLLAVVPSFSLAQLPLIEGQAIERLPAYWGSVVTLWLLGAASWLVGTREGGAADLGVVGLPAKTLVTWSVGLTLAGLGIIVAFRGVAVLTGAQDSPLLRALLPRTSGERSVFALLSVSAGFGEELAYRGYAIPVLAPLVGTGGAVAISSAVFGVVHGYQGVLGVVRTGLMGGVLACGFVATGSLWPAIVAHALIDLVAGLLLGERLLSHRRPNGVDETPVASSRPAPDR